MSQTLRNAWKIEDLRKKLLFTLLILVIVRLGCAIPVPFLDPSRLQEMLDSTQGNLLGYLNLLTGGAFAEATLFALGVSPYITASIVIQLLTVAIPSLERMAKEEGEEGQKKIARITRYTTVGLGLLMGWAYYQMLVNYASSGFNIITEQGFVPALVIILTFTAGSAFVMWLGEQITEFGIGNGISMILFASIISRLPTSVITSIRNISTGSLEWWVALLVFLGALAIIVLIVYVNDAERRVPVQYAKRVVGRKMYGGQSSILPLKVCSVGVMPLIFAMTILQVPGMIGQFWPKGKFNTFVSTYLSPATTNIAGIIIYYVLYAIMIVGFAYFYSSITFNPVEISKNLQQNGGFIPGIRPGRPTSDYLQKKCSRLTMFGALFLMIIAIIPTLLLKVLNITVLSAFGPTSILIMISVSIEIADQLDSLMIMRNHKGFLN